MRRNLICISTMIIQLLITGCNSDENEAQATNGPINKVAEKVLSPEPLKQVILTLGSWRKEDVEQINFILSKFNEKHPNIFIKFDPTDPSEYNAVIEAQLKSDTAPDLLYLRSFSHSRHFFEKGFLASLEDIPNIKKKFPVNILKAWSSRNDEIYAIPLMAVSHGIFYNETIFDELNLTIPDTWEKLLILSDTLKKKGYVPFSNATGDAWTINGLILQNVIPNIIGGKDGRLEYYNGDRCFNDEQMVTAFQAVQDIVPYISENQKMLKYADSLQLFIQGKIPMYFGGSWDIPFFESQKPDFNWSVFAIPAPFGKENVVTFHPDAGIGLNYSSAYVREAKLFLQWMMTDEFSLLIAQQLPGFYPMHNETPTIVNEHAQLFLEFNQHYKTDIRFVWGEIRDGDPSAYDISIQSSIDIMNNVITPKQAADNLQYGLASWYLPASQCQN